MENKKLKRVTMSVSHENPDARVNFKSIGIGKDQREAAIFALGSYLNVIDGISQEGITDYNQALEMVNAQYSEAEIVSFTETQIERAKDAFVTTYETTTVDYIWDEVEEETALGLIKELEIIEEEC
jgi:hypothetical protein